MRQIEGTLADLAAAAAAFGVDRHAQIPTWPSSANTGGQQPVSAAMGCNGKATQASGFSIRGYQSRVGRGAATVETPRWPLTLTVWRHRLKGLEAEHFFSLHCLGWTSEGGALQVHWKRTFLDAMDLLSSLLDRTGEIGAPLKPLRVCATACLRGVRFLAATMRFLWAYKGNFSASHWVRRSSPPTLLQAPGMAPLVTPRDLQECIERLHRVIAVSTAWPFLQCSSCNHNG